MDNPLDHDQQEEVADLLNEIALERTKPSPNKSTKTWDPSAAADDNVATMKARFLKSSKDMFGSAREMKNKAAGIVKAEEEWRDSSYGFRVAEQVFHQSYRDLDKALKPRGLENDEVSILLHKSFLASQGVKSPETEEEQQRKQVLRAESQKPPVPMDIADLELFLSSDVQWK